MRAEAVNANIFNACVELTFLRSCLEIPSKAPKGRNIIACGNATGDKPSSLSQALKGRNTIAPLQGLIN
jgi:hypothetical protein